MSDMHDIFGKNVFSDTVMREKLPSKTYAELKQHIDEGTPLTEDVANVVASAMKNWALSKGATHYTHWFQPMTGTTAEKHDSFITPAGGGEVIMHFSGKELIKGEPDASSFPSGGIRATFEARGYTAWDPSSNAFIKENTLCIPTAFCSYDGEALDKKTPLLLSMEAIENRTKELLSLFGEVPKRVITTVGPEQEYFLIPKELADKRKDIVYCGRTLFGAKPPKLQELDDHYFGAIKPKVQAYMKDLNEELWKMGVLANTEHNEVAPSQHELAPIFTTANIAADHNQLTMEMMKKVAERHGLVCLLHEKPFAGINGSGKHINWSLATDDGTNLLKPGKDPVNNLPFLLLLSAVIKGVDEYQDLLRISVASASNDHRLGGGEAPPAIISVFLGDDITAMLDAIESGKSIATIKKRWMDAGASVTADIKKDTTDRNRTSPFAFTGGRFEFRMPGSASSVSAPIYVINSFVASNIQEFVRTLKGKKDIVAAARTLVKQTYKKHKRIIFNGDNYSEEWIKEAEKRGLMNLPTVADAMPHYSDRKNIALFRNQGILSAVEIKARQEIHYVDYVNAISIEAQTMIDMITKEIIPAVSSYTTELSAAIMAKNQVSDLKCGAEKELLNDLSTNCDELYELCDDFKKLYFKMTGYKDITRKARFCADELIPIMGELRSIVDELEEKTSDEKWPMPSYGDLLLKA